jgi:hypothetical protein
MTATRTLYIIGSAAPPVRELNEACELAAQGGWQPCVVLTPTAAEWVDVARLRETTGRPVRIHPRRPDELDPFPPADAVLAAPLTFNTINKWAAGISDTLALGLLNEMLAGEVPIVAAPCANHALRQHPRYISNLAWLGEMGIHVLDQDQIVARGEDSLAVFDWPAVMESFAEV